MKKFNFRLQKVLEYKEHIEKKRQQELAIIQTRIDQAKQVLTDLNQEQNNYQTNCAESVIKGTTRENILMIEKYLQALKTKIKFQEGVLKQQLMFFKQKQQQLRAISNEKQSLEKYKEQKKEEHEKNLMAIEQDFLDEIALRKYK